MSWIRKIEIVKHIKTVVIVEGGQPTDRPHHFPTDRSRRPLLRRSGKIDVPVLKYDTTRKVKSPVKGH